MIDLPDTLNNIFQVLKYYGQYLAHQLYSSLLDANFNSVLITCRLISLSESGSVVL